MIAVPDVSVTLTARDRKGPLPEADLSTVVVSHALRAYEFDASEDGTGRGTPLVPVNIGAEPMTFDWQAGGGGNDKSFRGASRAYITDPPGRTRSIISNRTLAVAFQSKASSSQSMNPSEVSPALDVGKSDGMAVAFDSKDLTLGHNGATSTLTTNGDENHAGGRLAFADHWRVRRLTPTECARLQGFPDNYLSQVKYRGKPPADGPMYKAFGNSMACNVMRVLGQRIQMANDL